MEDESFLFGLGFPSSPSPPLPPTPPYSPLHSPPPLLPLPFSGLSASSTSSLTAEGKGPEGCQI